MSERDYLIAKAARDIDSNEYRGSVFNRFQRKGSGVYYKRGGAVQRYKNVAGGELKGTGVGAAAGGLAGAAATGAAFLHPGARRWAVRNATSLGEGVRGRHVAGAVGLKGAGIGAIGAGGVGGAIGSHKGKNKNIESGQIVIRNKKRGQLKRFGALRNEWE
jgi:hypothetical protein